MASCGWLLCHQYFANLVAAAAGSLFVIVDDAKTALAASNAPSLKAIEASPAAGVADNLANDGETAVPVLETTWTVLKGPRRLDAASAPEMVETCTSLLDANPRVVLDLSETVLLASAGLAALAQLNRTADERDGNCEWPTALKTSCGLSKWYVSIKYWLYITMCRQQWPDIA